MIRDADRFKGVPEGYAVVPLWMFKAVDEALKGDADLGVLRETDALGVTRLCAPSPLHEVFGALAHFTLRSDKDPEVVRLLRALATVPGMLPTGLGVVRMGGAHAFAEWVQTLGYRLGI